MWWGEVNNVYKTDNKIIKENRIYRNLGKDSQTRNLSLK